jgi:hypothetical protein
LSLPTGIREINVDLTSINHHHNDLEKFYDVARVWTGRLQSVEKLRISFILVDPSPLLLSCIERAMSDGNRNFGVDSKNEAHYQSNLRLLTWSWRAKYGEVLLWNDENAENAKGAKQ